MIRVVSVRLVGWSTPLGGAGDPRRFVVLAVKVSQGKLRRFRMEKYLRDYPRQKAGEWVLATRDFPSVLEHITFTFLIEDVSRVTSHQLVRHRIASYTQESQRYADAPLDHVTPPTITHNEKAKEIYEEAIKQARKAYEQLMKLGIPKEDARYVIPQAVTTTILMTVNLRELIHIAKQRLHPKAQWEIRELVRQMVSEASKIIPELPQLIQGDEQ